MNESIVLPPVTTEGHAFNIAQSKALLENEADFDRWVLLKETRRALRGRS